MFPKGIEQRSASVGTTIKRRKRFHQSRRAGSASFWRGGRAGADSKRGGPSSLALRDEVLRPERPFQPKCFGLESCQRRKRFVPKPPRRTPARQSKGKRFGILEIAIDPGPKEALRSEKVQKNEALRSNGLGRKKRFALKRQAPARILIQSQSRKRFGLMKWISQSSEGGALRSRQLEKGGALRSKKPQKRAAAGPGREVEALLSVPAHRKRFVLRK